MLSVDEALSQILAKVRLLDSEEIPLDHALGRILATDISANQNLPPFANSSMDGYAVLAADVQNATQDSPVSLSVIEDIPAGQRPQQTIRSGQAARIMTGAPLPDGADAIVPVEQSHGWVENFPSPVQIMAPVNPHDYVRPIGEDVRVGEVLLQKGRKLRPADLGLLAGLGIWQVEVIRQARVAILSTGDELLGSDDLPSDGKIYDSNGMVLPALVASLGAIPIRLGIARDTVEDVRAHLQKALEQDADIILSSAGVSVGAFDVVKTVLDELGKVDFWKVNMRPGKPLTFGEIGGRHFVGLPGNPVSAMVTFMVFVRPMIAMMMGESLEHQHQQAYVGEKMSSDGRSTFARVRLERQGEKLMAYSTGTQSSGAISSMVKADGLLIIPAGKKQVEVGEVLDVWPLDGSLL